MIEPYKFDPKPRAELMPKLPLVSIKIASYNHARYIRQTIQSVLDQTYPDFELIVVDDCSLDNSVEIIKSFSDPRIQLLVNEHNMGAASTSNRAKALCRGKYFCSLDSDDYFHPEKLARQVAFMEAHPEVDVLATFVDEIDNQGNHLAEPASGNWFSQNLDFNRPESWLFENHLCHSSALMKRDVHDRLWSYDSGLPLTNDWHNWIRFLANGAVFAHLPERLTYYRRHAENVTHRNPERAYWEHAYTCARELHPYLARIGRRDLIRESIRNFFFDDRYPASKAPRERLLCLLLNLGVHEREFEAIWRNVTNANNLPSNGLRDEISLIEEMRQELVESKRHMLSMRMDDQQALIVPRLLDALTREKWSLMQIAKIGYLTSASVVPDILKWPLRPLAKVARRQFRRLKANRGNSKPYRIRSPIPALGRRPRILHAIGNFSMGGSSRLVVDLIENLGHDYEQRVLAGFIPSPAAYSGCVAQEYRSSFEIRAVVEKWRPDIVHVHYWGDTDWAWYDKVFRVAEEAGCKIIENVNTPTTPYVAKTLQHYVYVSNYVMETFGRAESRSSVVYPGSNFDMFSRKDTGEVPDNCIGMVYRLDADKLGPAAIEPFILVSKRRPNTRVLIVGDGCFLDHYKQRVAENGLADSFRFTGAVTYTDLPAFYAEMSLFVAPVQSESFGQVTPFAMSMGLPVAGYAVGALDEILGDAEFLAPPGDSERLADIVIRLLDDRSKRLAIGDKNRQRAHSLFSVESMIRSYQRIYRETLSDGA